MKKILTLILVSILTTSLYCQADLFFNLELESTFEYSQNCNDIWGYVDENGDEYALLGTVTGTAVIALDGPEAPYEVAFIPGDQAIWRDIKTWGDYAYVTVDNGTDGLLIIDLSEVENDSISYSFWQEEIEGIGLYEESHNIYIDEFGYIYLAGRGNFSSDYSRTVVLDPRTNPMDPEIIGFVGSTYAHDIYVQDNIAFASEIYEGELALYDVSNKDTIVKLGSTPSTGAFTHNAWASADNNYVFTTDEIINGYVDAFDVSDPTNIEYLSSWQPENARARGVVPHNAHFMNGFLYVSWYIDGLIVLDVNDPENMVRVAQYDTYQGNEIEFNGSWGAYPFLPSGRILVSDINSGLFVFQPQFEEAARIQGRVTDVVTGDPLNNVEIDIQYTYTEKFSTSPNGSYKSGVALSEDSLIIVEYKRAGYITKSDTLLFQSGQTIDNDVALMPENPIVDYDIVVIDQNGKPIAESQVEIVSEFDFDYMNTTNIEGKAGFTRILSGTVDIRIAKWGYKEVFTSKQIVGFDIDTFVLEPGYMDNFNFDLGWETINNARTGPWERGKPQLISENIIIYSPGQDSDDSGEQAYITGLDPGNSSGANDIDDGTNYLISPSMDLSSFDSTLIQFDYWFVNEGGILQPNDTLKAYIITATDTLEFFNASNTVQEWQKHIFHLESLYLGDKSNIRIQFSAADDFVIGHLVEAGIDQFVVNGYAKPSSAQDAVLEKIQVYPNPAYNFIFLDQKGHYTLCNLKGEQLQSGSVVNGRISVGDLPNGIYLLQLNNTDKTWSSKILIQR